MYTRVNIILYFGEEDCVSVIPSKAIISLVDQDSVGVDVKVKEIRKIYNGKNSIIKLW